MLAKKPVAALCVAILPSYAECLQEIEAGKFSAAAKAALAPLCDALRMCQSVARALLHLLCVDVPEGLPRTEDSEVLRFVNYSGSDQVENCVRRLFTNTSLFWHKDPAQD